MPGRLPLSEMTVAQLRERAAEYAKTPYHREAFGRVAKRYAALAAEREAEEERAERR